MMMIFFISIYLVCLHFSIIYLIPQMSWGPLPLKEYIRIYLMISVFTLEIDLILALMSCVISTGTVLTSI